MGVADRWSQDLALIRSEGFAGLCRARPEDFTRRRKLPADVLCEALLARRGRSLKLELRDLRLEADVDASRQGYLKARGKLSPDALLELSRHHAASVYAQREVRTLCGMVPVAIDGTSAAVPTNEATLERYGNASNPGTRPQATAGVSAGHDPHNRQTLDLAVRRGAFDERAEVMGHLVAATRVTGGRPVIALLDRGYPSLLPIAQIGCAGVFYLARRQSRFLEPEFRACEEAGGDLWVEIPLTRRRLHRMLESDSPRPAEVDALVAMGTLRVRLALVDLGDGKLERLATNVGADVLPHEALKDAYHDRWPCETSFEFMKDRLQMENFTGTRPTLIEQDIYATAYLLNLAFDLANEADAVAQGEIAAWEGAEAERRAAGDGDEGGEESAPRRYKHRMTVNRTFAIGILKEELYALILADDDARDALMAALVEEAAHELVPVRPDRPNHPRDGLKGHRARRHSNTHKRAF